jgi:heme/copper-type cytochrome/quinol oxidase subunit 4
MGTSGGPSPLAAPGPGERAQARLRWPHPDRTSVIIAGVWGLGLVVALLVPAFIVGPGEQTAPASQVWTAFACTVVGAMVMLLSAMAMYRHSGDWADAVWGIVPAASVIVGGVILTATKLSGSGIT